MENSWQPKPRLGEIPSQDVCPLTLYELVQSILKWYLTQIGKDKVGRTVWNAHKIEDQQQQQQSMEKSKSPSPALQSPNSAQGWTKGGYSGTKH